MEPRETYAKATNLIRNSATLKMLIIGALILILLIPTSMISSLLVERESRHDSVIKEINQKWGGRQTITGPFITVPYKTFSDDLHGKLVTKINHLYILPENLNISGKVNPEVRYRSNYEAVLYNLEVSMEGSFILPSFVGLKVKKENVLWDKAFLCLGITDMRGIQENIIYQFDKKEYSVSPGLQAKDIATAGVSSPISIMPDQVSHVFSLKLNINGSEQLQFIPIGKETTVTLTSAWPSPSFNGAFLPVIREVGSNGFSATWKVLQLNRNYPQYWTGSQYDVESSAFGLDLLITTDIYQKSDRISKYAIIFIVFTFSAFFFSEIISKKQIHPVQYLLVGLAVSLFYILLLSLSEHVSFNIAYLISACGVTCLITGYSRGILKSKAFTITILSILVSLYSYLYIVIQQEEFALIMGSSSLFVVLGVVMFITRKINWYSLEGDIVEKA